MLFKINNAYSESLSQKCFDSMAELASLHVFCRVVECKSFSAAARSLDVPLSTVSRMIQQLERRLKVSLLLRTTRSVRATADGLAFYQRVAPLLGEIADAEQALLDMTSQVQGDLVISAPASVAQLMLAPAMATFLARHPGIGALTMRSTDRLSDLAAEGVDCAIRTGIPEDDRLVAREIVSMPQYFAASPALLARYPPVEHIADLAALPFVHYVFDQQPKSVAVHARCADQSHHFSAKHQVSADDGQTYVGLALAALGVIEAPAYDINRWLENGQLELLLPDWCSDPLRFYLVYRQSRHLSRRVRAFADWASALIAEPRWRTPQKPAKARQPA